MPVDIVIPLGCGSKSNDDELKILLRSIEKNCTGYNKIWIVTAFPPKWVLPNNNLKILWMEDTFTHNKDANLFEKLVSAMEVCQTENIIWSCDDCAILKPTDLSCFLPVYNRKTLSSFKEKLENKWQIRMVATLEEIGMTNGHWDTHCPQIWNVREAMVAIKQVPYKNPEGRCINTAVMGRIYKSKIPDFAIPQRKIKETIEDNKVVPKLNNTIVSYNDNGFLSGLREQLFALFPSKSQWEK